MDLNIEIPISVITIINFFILYFVLRHFLFKPINETLSARRTEIDTKLKSAEENKIKAEQYMVESEINHRDSKVKGKALVEEYKNKAEKLYAEIVSNAQVEAQRIVERAVRETEREKEKAQAELKTQVIELAVMVSEKALEETISEVTHKRLIDEFIAKVGS
ncbi:F0F1 ATP synthase subunit B [Clostridium thermarum]|uniref:F0F1 ATP synthase subunit B n=1 Tax=Clostridium thermarum TaxID=1716543 RepID=UPI0013D209D2|nr:F0F1 ATP synthase subunit B [Clostridium thermarum]